jgi:hypothetical protein
MVLASCTRNDPSDETGTAPTSEERVPITLVPPDSISDRALVQAGIVKDETRGDLRNLLVLSFKTDASVAQRQAAIDSIGGVVVGGSRFFEDSSDGTYYVRLRSQTLRGLLDGREVLRRQSGVAGAGLWELDSKYFEPVPVKVPPPK